MRLGTILQMCYLKWNKSDGHRFSWRPGPICGIQSKTILRRRVLPSLESAGVLARSVLTTVVGICTAPGATIAFTVYCAFFQPCISASWMLSAQFCAVRIGACRRCERLGSKKTLGGCSHVCILLVPSQVADSIGSWNISELLDKADVDFTTFDRLV